MRVRKVEKDAKSYRITLDSEEVYVFTQEGFYHLGIREGDEITEEEHFKEALEKDRFRLLKHRALSYLGSGSKTRRQLRTKYKAEGYSAEELERLIHFLEQYDLLNEASYLEHSIQKLQEKGASRQQAQQALSQKGFEDGMIRASLENWSEEMEAEHAMKLAKKKWGSIKGETQAQRREKLLRMLSAKGFPWISISAALDSVASETDADQELWEEEQESP